MLLNNNDVTTIIAYCQIKYAIVKKNCFGRNTVILSSKQMKLINPSHTHIERTVTIWIISNVGSEVVLRTSSSNLKRLLLYWLEGRKLGIRTTAPKRSMNKSNRASLSVNTSKLHLSIVWIWMKCWGIHWGFIDFRHRTVNKMSRKVIVVIFFYDIATWSGICCHYVSDCHKVCCKFKM